MVRTDLKADLPMIMGDESQLKQVIINLFTNALDATREGGKNKIITRIGQGKGIILLVEDSGMGIPAELQNQLFEPFFTTKPVGQGIGIGLSTCYSIVNNHNGEILVASDEEHGTSFRVYLPGMDL